MVHRGLPERKWLHQWWFPLVVLVFGAVAFSGLFILGDLMIYGHVNW